MAQLNAFERAIASVSPGWGARRLSDKFGLEQVQETVRGFDAARHDRRTASWQTSGGSISREMSGALPTIRNRSRDMVRNNEWARNAKQKLVAHIVGTGFTPRPPAGLSKTTKKRRRDLWNAFSDNCDPEGLSDWNGKQAQAIGEVVEGGAAFIRWYVRPPEWGLKVPLQCEVLEHDHLDLAKTEILPSGNVVISGVEYDSFGRRAAYWLFPIHPGEITLIRSSTFLSERVPASEVDHIFRIDRAGQVTGVPWLAPTLLRLRDAGDYEEAELVRKKIEACLTIFVRRTGQGASNLAQREAQGTDKRGRRLEKIAPGMIAYLNDGEEVSPVTPTPSNGYVDHMTRQLLASAAATGLPYSSISGDLTRTNFSSMREGKLDFWPLLDQWQWLMAVPQMLRTADRRVLAAATARGQGVSGDSRSEWTPPRRPWVDPLKDAKAKETELALGLESWREEVAARGYDPDERLEEMEQDAPLLAKAGIAFGQAPGIPSQEDANDPPAAQ
ncbi:phage portal protein [Xanthobacter sp. VTT E-85241]|uniref:phage portal protein n=1 Tax=Roseixanthobacter finlandensis TaxID=3119922 RepID=UPI003729B077